MAACYLLLDGAAKPQAAGLAFRRGWSAEVTKRNPHAGEFYFALASQLEARNKQTEAEPYFREAIRVMPRQIGPEGHLGLLYMHAGREDDARRTLRAAFRADPFNVRVKNSLEVLDVLEAMQTLERARFTVRYQGAEDKLLARYAARHLEKVYPLLCRRFGYDPPGKTLVEIFNQARGLDGHQWFSARMVGLPYLDTVAASTGRIVAMVSPNEPQLGHHLNWARVLTHETVHVINLQQTHFDCPHWFTEGLAVWSENSPAAAGVVRVARAAHGQRQAVQPRNPQLRLHPAAIERRLGDGLLPGGIVRRVHACGAAVPAAQGAGGTPAPQRAASSRCGTSWPPTPTASPPRTPSGGCSACRRRSSSGATRHS